MTLSLIEPPVTTVVAGVLCAVGVALFILFAVTLERQFLATMREIDRVHQQQIDAIARARAEYDAMRRQLADALNDPHGERRAQFRQALRAQEEKRKRMVAVDGEALEIVDEEMTNAS